MIKAEDSRKPHALTHPRFSFDLCFESEIAFHFNPRFNENAVVRNSFLKERWGQEERSRGMPFYRSQPFMVMIVCDEQFYKVIVNGAQIFTYNHRHSVFQEIHILKVNGDVTLSSVVV
ncbi:galectin-9-like [Megalops cyprinoides]|uniref:galectin-9-like n=1 Tax=Megalops cyprinoides TaxID=118141 RepID=UPI001864D2E7|nr:galectin-9-like [Megalops cyprinoides]